MKARNVGHFDDLIRELEGDVEYQKAYRQQKPYYDIIHEIVNRRKQLNLTQEELAARVNLPQSNISRIESGTHNIKLNTLIDIAEALEAKLKIQFNPIYKYTDKEYTLFFTGYSSYKPISISAKEEEYKNYGEGIVRFGK
jgi:transcriptional regulator with XRE-family HTH domain